MKNPSTNTGAKRYGPADSSIRHDMARILQISCDADEADPRELLGEIGKIAASHPWPDQPRPEAGAEREAKGLNGWVMPSIQPDTEREVLLLMKPIRKYSDRILIGRYEAWRGWWRPRGSNGNFVDEIAGWRELLSIPDATDSEG